MTQTFVTMYHPQLGDARVLVSLSSVDDHAGKGWLLVSGDTPAPSSPYLTPAVADGRYLAKPTGGTDGQALVKSGTGVTWGAAGLTAAQLAAAPEMAAAFDPAGAAAAAVTPSAVAANLPARLADTALKAAFGPADPVLSAFTYDSTTGNLLSYQEDGITITLTYNADGTVATQKRGTGPTRTFTYSGGNLAGVA